MISINDDANAEFLKRLLANGPLPTWYIMREAKEERIKKGLVGTKVYDYTKTAIHKAKRKLKLKTVNNGDGSWSWELPC